MVKLLSIEHDGPIRLRELGKAGQGIDWTVQPENFQRVVDMVNEYGGPGCWSIEPL